MRRELPRRVNVLSILLAIMAAILPFATASADGKYFPQNAYKVPPAIPTQRTILVYRDGIETLIIESALEGPGQEFGWVIPLPSRPTRFEEASPGLIKTLSWVVQPDVTHRPGEEMSLIGVFTLVVTLLCLIGLTIPRPYRTVLLPIIILLVVSYLLPLKRAGGIAGSVPGVEEQPIGIVGSYDLAVLKADDVEPLHQWLLDNGFTGLGEDDRTVVTDYIRDGWCFVAAKLRREGDGYSRPHPLLMSFATETPVYPMRLTATAGSDVYLKLFTVAEKRPTCERLTLEVADVYGLQKGNPPGISTDGRLTGFVGKTYRQEIGHPDAAEHLWDGCVLSKLCARLQPHEMRRDIVLQFTEGPPYQARYYSRHGAKQVALAYSLGAWCLVLIPLSIVVARRIRPTRKRVLPFLRVAVIPALTIALLVWIVTYTTLPKVDVASLTHAQSPHRVYDRSQRAIRSMEVFRFAEQHDYFAGKSPEQVVELLADYYASDDHTNPFTGEPMRHEDSPGNYTLHEDDGGIVWSIYSIEGYPDEYVLTSPPPWEPTDEADAGAPGSG